MHGYATFNMTVLGPQICCRYETCTARPQNEHSPWKLRSRDICEKAKQYRARNNAKCSKCLFLCNNSDRTWFFNALTFARSLWRCWKPRPSASVFNTSHGTWWMLMHKKKHVWSLYYISIARNYIYWAQTCVCMCVCVCVCVCGGGVGGGKRTFWHVSPTTTQTSLHIRAVRSESLLSAWRNFAILVIQNAFSEDSVQTARMHRLILIPLGTHVFMYVFWVTAHVSLR